MGTAALVNIWHLSDREKIVIRGIAVEAEDSHESKNDGARPDATDVGFQEVTDGMDRSIRRGLASS